MKSKLMRFGVSLDGMLLKKFDEHIQGEGYSNRSKAIADLIRKEFVSDELVKGGKVAGAITVVYDHHQRDVVNRLLDIQHEHGGLIISSQHVHMSHHDCLEIIAVKGPAQKVISLASALKAVRGVRHSTLGVTSAGG